MIGWEFPPKSVGGLGTHTYELVNELKGLVSISLVLPFKARVEGIRVIPVPARYLNPYKLSFSHSFIDSIRAYNENIVKEVLGKRVKFDIIHVHDWIGVEAGIRLKRLTGRPLVVTFHATEYDRTAGHPWEVIKEIEQRAVNEADGIIAVSNLMKEELIKYYHADPSKIDVIYNGINPTAIDGSSKKGLFGRKVVLYLGRLAIQKNPESLIRAIPLVLEKEKNVVFIIAGSGELLPRLAKLSVDLGVKDHVIFTGRVTDQEKEFLYKISDVFVLPSVSEPFGITVLEAASKGVVPIISKTVGAGEQVDALEVDFWDVNKLAEYILAVMKYPVLGNHVKENNIRRLTGLSWARVARRTLKKYKKVLRWK